MTHRAVQRSLFGQSRSAGGEYLDGLLAYLPALFDEAGADDLFDQLRSEVVWRQPRIRLFGRDVKSPRLAAWHGDPDAVYTYSGLRNEPLPWTEPLVAVRRRVEVAAGARFNSVLLNFYRDGDDAMGWHSDDEPTLHPEAPIASLSLGCERRFSLKHRRLKNSRLDLHLGHGSLLIMRAPMQRDWRHALPRARGVHDGRINLTFRCVA